MEIWQFLLLVLLAFTPLQALADQLTTNAVLGQSRDQPNTLIFGLFIGVMLTAAVYLFFIWLIVRDRGQVFLLLLLVCLGVNMTSNNDDLMKVMGLDAPGMRDFLSSYSMILAYIFAVFFTHYFLELDINAPQFGKLLFSIAGFLFVALVWSVFDASPIRFALTLLGTITISVIILVAVWALNQGISGSVTHILAFSFLMAGAQAKSLYSLGWIMDMETANNLSYTFFSIGAMTFAIVIAGQFAARQDEKERDLAVSNERFALAAKGSNEGLFDYNVETGDVFFSDQFKNILGTVLENKFKSLKIWLSLIFPADRLTIVQALRRFRKNPRASAINFEYRIKHKESYKWLQTKTVVTREGYSGKITRYVGSLGDITARKNSEAALRASETRFRSITEAHPVPVLIVGLLSRQIGYISPGAEALLGLPHNMIASYRLERILPNAAEREDIVAAISRDKELNLKEVTIMRADGSTLIAALSARRINYDNEVAMVIGLYDLTERKSAEAQIAKQKEELQQSEKMAALGGLLAGVAHELNNPLSVVVGQATLLIEGSEDTKIVTRGEKIFKAADRCARIVKSFLALARRKPPERKSQDINQIINSSLELLAYQLRNENIELELNFAENLPAIDGDSDQLTQVFTNLALNALQALQGWQGKRKLAIATEVAEDRKIVITFADTGPGIPKDVQSRVFEPFFTTKGQQGGTGIGLSLCLSIIESHNGQLKLNDCDQGACFIITLPTAVSAATTNAPNATTEGYPLLPSRILLVDDEVELAQTLGDLLQPEGHQITLAANGQVALDKLRAQSFDFIISDLRMPVMDGPTLYTELVRSLPHYLLRIIYVTGDTMSPHVQTFLEKTPVPLVEKPYRLQDVKKALFDLQSKLTAQQHIDDKLAHSTTDQSSIVSV